MRSSVAQSCLTLCDPVDCSPPGSSVHGVLQARALEWVAMPSCGDLPHPGIEPRSPALQVDSLPAEPPWKPKNTGVGRLSLLQGIFLTQESNQGLLHCRWILYQLSCQGNPVCTVLYINIRFIFYTIIYVYSIDIIDTIIDIIDTVFVHIQILIYMILCVLFCP